MQTNFYIRFKGKELFRVNKWIAATALLAGAIAAFLILSGCQPKPDPKPDPIVKPAVQPVQDAGKDAAALGANAKDQGKDAKAIPPHQKAIVEAVAGTPAAPVVQPHADATVALAGAIESRAAEAERRATSAEVGLALALGGIRERDDGIVARDKLLAAARRERDEAREELKSKDDNDTKIFLRIVAGVLIVGGAAGAFLLGQAGSIIRAIAAGATGLGLGLCCLWAAANLTLLWWIIGGGVAGAVLIGLGALWLHHRKHMAKKDDDKNDLEEVLWMLTNIAKDGAIAGAKGVVDLADEAAHTTAEKVLTDKQFKIWLEKVKGAVK
jgi:hypothetical protein